MSKIFLVTKFILVVKNHHNIDRQKEIDNTQYYNFIA